MKETSPGELLKQLRNQKGFNSQAELAERAEISRTHISSLERGVRTNPSKETLRSIGKALELTSDEQELLEVTFNPPKVATHPAQDRFDRSDADHIWVFGDNAPILQESLRSAMKVNGGGAYHNCVSENISDGIRYTYWISDRETGNAVGATLALYTDLSSELIEEQVECIIVPPEVAMMIATAPMAIYWKGKREQGKRREITAARIYQPVRSDTLWSMELDGERCHDLLYKNFGKGSLKTVYNQLQLFKRRGEADREYRGYRWHELDLP